MRYAQIERQANEAKEQVNKQFDGNIENFTDAEATWNTMNK